jgi:DNA-directed RNA polymerase specialized sigma24 family protein
MKADSSLNQEQFDELLAWLDPDPARAGERYEQIRKRLIQIFLNRGCAEAEDLADETINRVARKVIGLKEKYVGDPAPYFYAVAKKVHMEHVRHCSRRPQGPLPEPPRSEMEPHLKCLDECLAKLKPESRQLILRYYEEQKQAKIRAHKEMGAALRVKGGALRARAFRIRAKLEKCVEECLRRAAESNDITLNCI